MAENDEAIAERRPGGGDAQLHLFVRQPEISLGQRLPFVEALLFHFVENGQKCGARGHGCAFAGPTHCELVKLFAISGHEKTKRGGPAHLAGASTWLRVNYSNV